MGTNWEQSGNKNPKVGQKISTRWGPKWEQGPKSGARNLNKVRNKGGSRTQKRDKNRNKVGAKWGQELRSGKRMGTKWEQEPKRGRRMGTKWEESGSNVGTKWVQEPKSGARNLNNARNKVGTRTQNLDMKFEQSGKKMRKRIQ